MKKLSYLFILFICIISCGGGIWSVVDNTKPIIVQYQVDSTRYRVGYKYHDRDYFMEIITNDSLKPGDTLIIIKK